MISLIETWLANRAAKKWAAKIERNINVFTQNFFGLSKGAGIVEADVFRPVTVIITRKDGQPETREFETFIGAAPVIASIVTGVWMDYENAKLISPREYVGKSMHVEISKRDGSLAGYVSVLFH